MINDLSKQTVHRSNRLQSHWYNDTIQSYGNNITGSEWIHGITLLCSLSSSSNHQSDSSCWSRLCDVTPDPFGTLRCSAEDTTYIHTTLHQTPHRHTHYCKTLSDSQHCATSSSTCCYTDSDTAVMCAITEL